MDYSGFGNSSPLFLLKELLCFFLQSEVFPYPEIRNEELEEIRQFVTPVEKFFNEEGEIRHYVKSTSVTTEPFNTLCHVLIIFS